MSCPDCGDDLLAVRVPADLREYVDHVPEETVAVCLDCLRTHSSSLAETVTTDPSEINETIPDGGGGVAFLLACGKLGSLAVNRPAIIELFEYAEREGVDVLLTLDRLATELEDPHFDVERRTKQVGEFL
ncbi:DUF6276 family protein [Halopenitus sp. H-Gu1]|uniref:DUF6276 family protein n=1 Tax=Halopenitus sp. H-Gu1 TaxID=3242697 RepID=UPI00359D1D5F